MQILLALILILVVGTFLYMRSDRFGALAQAERLKRMQSYPNFKDGAFENLEYTPALAEGTSNVEVFKSFFFAKKVRNAPVDSIPVVQTNLKQLPADSNLYVWFGHSSYLLQLDGKKILVDPVFSKYASPVRFGIKAFLSTYSYSAEDMPEIDILVITHDHWDHLDYNTFKALQHKVKHIITAIGVGAHLEKWGFAKERITELYWGEQAELLNFKFTSTPSRHFSGRTFKRNTSLWSSFVLQSASKKIFIGGDSGYGKHFKEIGDSYGPFDYAIIENGQYNKMWKYIHLMPEQVITVSQELKTKMTIPVHSSKFPLAHHPWDEPLIRVTQEAQRQNFPLLMPKIGQPVSLDHPQEFPQWWQGLN